MTVTAATYKTFHSTPPKRPLVHLPDNSQSLATLIVRYLPDVDKTALSLVDHRFSRISKIPVYNLFKSSIAPMFEYYRTGKSTKVDPIPVCIKIGNEEENLCKIVDILGFGGSKCAYLLDIGRALLLPNMNNSQTIAATAAQWPRIVHEETAMTSHVSSLGLRCSPVVPVSVSFTPWRIMPAYLSTPFSALTKENTWIIDRQNPSTWKKGIHSFFKDKKEALKEENWDPVLQLLLHDIGLMIKHNIPGGDSLSFAVIKKGEHYHVRYFGFDFSSKREILKIPKTNLNLTPETVAADATFFLKAFLPYLLYYDLDESSYDDLFNRLVARYTPRIVSTLCPPATAIAKK